MILTVQGESKVEDLAIGDLLPTMFGGVCPIQWIGRYSIKKSNPSSSWPKQARPVRIARSALAPNVPSADLYVTQAHGLYFEGVLISAGCLLNKTTIVLAEASGSDRLDFFHIKLENHDVIFADGAPVESLLDVAEGAANFAEFYRAHGFPQNDQVPCVPILSDTRRESGLKARIRSAASWVDRRRQIRAIRDRLAQRGSTLRQELELSDKLVVKC